MKSKKIKTWYSFLISGAVLFATQAAFATISGLSATSDATNVSYSYSFTGAPTQLRVYLDTDVNASTGYSFGGVGANYMIENGYLYRYSGSGGTAWGWTSAGSSNMVKSTSSVKFTVSRSSLGSPAKINLVANTSSGDRSAIVSQTLSSNSVTWTRCATEGGVCSFTGTRQVRYGANSIYAYRTATGSISCNNETFGDPIVGVAKSCDYSSVVQSVPVTTTLPPPPTTTTTTLPATVNSITLNVAGAPNLPYNGTTTLVTVGFLGATPSKVTLARDGFNAFATWPGGTFFTLAADGKSISGNWCISASCWGYQPGTHVLMATATYADGSTKSVSVTLNVVNSTSTTTTLPPPPTTTLRPTTTTLPPPPTTTTTIPVASGPTYYVSPSGNDLNAGTSSSPWKTIQKAADTVSAGATVILMDGTYEEPSIRISRGGTATAPITFRAQRKWMAILASTSGCNPGISINASYITLQDFRLSVSSRNANCATYTSSNAHVRAFSSKQPTPSSVSTGYQGFVLRGMKVDNTSARSEGIKSNQDYTIMENSESGHSLELMNNRESIVRNNTILGQARHGISIFAKGGLRNARIHGNVIRNKAVNGQAILIGGYSCDACHFDPSTNIEAYNVVAFNNIIVNESGGAMAGLMFQGAKDSAFFNNVVINGTIAMTIGGHNTGPQAPTSNPTFKNNIFVCSGAAVTSGYHGWRYSGTLNFDYNNLYSCSSAPAQVHPIVGNPMFVNQTSDWHLQAGSPAINSGVSVTMPAYGGGLIDVSRDKDGVLRTAPWDLGAYNAN